MPYTESLASLTIGSVESVAPDEVRVAIDLDAPQATALNAGLPSRFPRLNGFLLVPNETGSLVGLVTWLGVERSPFPKRTGLRDFGLVDLPFPLRKLLLSPVGTLRSRRADDGGLSFELERGVFVFPSVGDLVLLPTAAKLRSVVEASGTNHRVWIGTSPLSADARVHVDPDKVFGRHVAVLGNTGSGKSCTVAGLIRWSIAAATEEDRRPNARFIVLDPNGEYRSAFSDDPAVRVFEAPVIGVKPSGNSGPLSVPAWFWNGREWVAFAQAAPGVQRPLLLQALRAMRAGRAVSDEEERALAGLMRSYQGVLDSIIAQGPSSYGADFRGRMDCGRFLRTLMDDAAALTEKVPSHSEKIASVVSVAQGLVVAKASKGKDGVTYFDAFTNADLLTVRSALADLIGALPSVDVDESASEDAPVEFDLDDLPGFLEVLAKSSAFTQSTQYIPPLVARIRSMLADSRLAPIINPSDRPSLEGWLEGLLGDGNPEGGQIAIIDLSLVPSDVLHLTVAVIARLMFEANQRYRKATGEELPTVLVLEEAHSFIQRSGDQDGEPATTLCRETFEKIAREGRKFGLGLVLASQRPSELSATVLAQCNTFILHRIVNDRDQNLVAHLVPDNLAGLLRDLPSLPSRQAILTGWASVVPTMVVIRELPYEQRPHSEDPSYWKVWRHEAARPLDWGSVAGDWTMSAETLADETPEVQEPGQEGS